jgi:putative spermidine/putrescine transport system permease protein
MKRLADQMGVIAFSAILVSFLLFLVAPLVVAFAMSFDARTFVGRFPPTGLSLQWYRKFFADETFLGGLWTSVLLGLSTAVLSSVIGTGAALFLHRSRFRGRAALVALFLSPLLVPHIVFGFALLIFLTMMGIDDVFTGLLIGHVLVTLPYTIRTVLASLSLIPAGLVEASMVLGANEYRALWDVVIPMARPGIVAGAIISLAVSMDEVTMSVFLIDPFTYTLPTALFATMRDSFNLVIASASVLMIAVSFLSILLIGWLVGLDRVIGAEAFRK